VKWLKARFLFLVLGAMLIIGQFGIGPSAAIEQLRVYRGVLILEGKLERGDFEKVRDFLGNQSNFEKITGGVFLASPGGNIGEAIKLGYFIRALRLDTDAPSGPPGNYTRFGPSRIAPNNLADPKNYLCTSACFFVYVGGVHRSLGWVGRLGIHRPIQVEGNANFDVEQTLNVNWKVRGLIKTYFDKMDVPDKYVDLMYSIAPNEVRWITKEEFSSDLGGFIPEMNSLLASKCGTQTPAQSDAALKCWTQTRSELSREAWTRMYAKK